MNAQAAGLADLVIAANNGSFFSSQTRDAIVAQAETAKARIGNFTGMSRKLELDEKLTAWAMAHRDKLAAEARMLERLTQLLAEPQLPQ
ncbi:MAG TPA: hypothetical protein VEK08_09015 [Planctomycetota bacterium]|nr:hypothetical protein [Planctomycetota bacterium]